MAGAVHGFQAELVLLDGEGEHVILVVLPMAGRLPQLGVVHVGRADLIIPSLPVLGTQERLEGVVDPLTVREEETGARRKLMEEEELLLASDLPMISPGGLLKIFLVSVHQGLLGE